MMVFACTYVDILRYICIIALSSVLPMRVDLSPWLGGTHSGQSTPPHYCPPLIHVHSPSARNGVKSHSRCGTDSWTELELAFHLTV